MQVLSFDAISLKLPLSQVKRAFIGTMTSMLYFIALPSLFVYTSWQGNPALLVNSVYTENGRVES